MSAINARYKLRGNVGSVTTSFVQGMPGANVHTEMVRSDAGGDGVIGVGSEQQIGAPAGPKKRASDKIRQMALEAIEEDDAGLTEEFP